MPPLHITFLTQAVLPRFCWYTTRFTCLSFDSFNHTLRAAKTLPGLPLLQYRGIHLIGAVTVFAVVNVASLLNLLGWDRLACTYAVSSRRRSPDAAWPMIASRN